MLLQLGDLLGFRHITNMERVLSMEEIATLRCTSFAMTIELKTCSIQQFAKTANWRSDDRTKNVFDSAVCKNSKLLT
jgi:hypothetical protein